MIQNNQAFVATLKNITKIDGADKIVKADVTLNNVVVTSIVTGVDTKEDTSIVYFDSNMCLTENFIRDYPDLARYLSKGVRVKVVKLKNTISNGLAVDVKHFYRYFKSNKEAIETLVEGYSFTEIGENKICYKYMAPIKVQNQISNKKGRKGKTESRMIPGQFHFHIDTDQLSRNAFKIKPESIVSISRKIHGTSAICGNALVKKKLSFKNKIAQVLGFDIVYREYDYIYASRTVVKNGSTEKGNLGFYGEDLWSSMGEKYFKDKLHLGETVYYEIVGYLPSGKFIQKDFDYGCKPKEYKIAVYRITKTGIDGDVVEYGWQAMKERCIELNVPHVEELYFGKAKDLFPELDVSEHWNENFVKKLKDKYLEKDAAENLCKKVPDEGIVLRVEAKGIEVYKLKSERFYLKESESKDNNEEDLEEQEASSTI